MESSHLVIVLTLSILRDIALNANTIVLHLSDISVHPLLSAMDTTSGETP